MNVDKHSRKIIYIVSDQRSGSTLLDFILTSIPESISVGELRLLSDYLNCGKVGATSDWSCSCGNKVRSCHFWSEVKERVLDKMALENISNTKINRGAEDEEISTAVINQIYQAVFDIHDIQVIIDSSKNAYQGLAVLKSSPYRVKIIYIKRDIRAVAISKQAWNMKLRGKKVSLFRYLLTVKMREIIINSAINKVKHEDVMAIEYEKLSGDPQSTLDRITDFCEVGRVKAPDYMYRVEGHEIAGTPSKKEKREIKSDMAWVEVANRKPIFNLLGRLLSYL